MNNNEQKFLDELKQLQSKYGIQLEAVITQEKPSNGFLVVKAVIAVRSTNGAPTRGIDNYSSNGD